MLRWNWTVSLCCILGLVSLAMAGPTFTDPDKADADFAYQGEYVGNVKTDAGEIKIGLQVIALGDGKFHAVGCVL